MTNIFRILLAHRDDIVYGRPFTELSLNGNNLSGEYYYDNTVSKNHHNFTKVVIDICNDQMDRDVFEGKFFLKYLKKWAVIHIKMKYRHSSISAVSISAIFNLARFMIVPYFPPL